MTKKPFQSTKTLGEGVPPQELFDIDKFKHRDLKVFSLINQSLWDKARWKVTAYVTFPDPNQPPFMALGFSDAEAGKAIFEEWLRKIGRIDSAE